MENLKKLFVDLIGIFGLELWDGELCASEAEGGAEIHVDLPYRRFRITIQKDFKDQDPITQAKIMLHEFCHFFNVPLMDLAEDMRDGKLITTSHMTDIMEYCNTRAEQVLYKVANSNELKHAIERYASAGGIKGRKGDGKGGGKRRSKGKK